MEDTEPGCLTLDQLNLLMIWFSPAYPVGSFAYSHGLEAAVTKGSVTDPGQLRDWVGTMMLHGSGRSDGVIFREAHTAVRSGDNGRLDEIAELSAALLPTEELALECRAQGEAFFKASSEVWPAERMSAARLDSPTYPVAAAVTCASHDVPLSPSLASWYHSTASALVSAGVRLIPLGQTQGLKVLASLSECVARACRQAQTVCLDEIGSAAPLMEIDSIHHETQYSRLFRS